MHRVLERQLRKLGIGHERPTAEQWARLLERVDIAYKAADDDRYTLERALDLSSEEMRKRFRSLRSTQEELVLASRKAGMADVATSVLHNVGNVLNSVNISAGIVLEATRKSAQTDLAKALALLTAQPQPGKFIDEDPRGKKLIPFLVLVDKALGDERQLLLREAESLVKHVDHIKSIVVQQLAVVRGDKRGPKVNESVDLAELLDDAVAIVRASTDTRPIAFHHERTSIVTSTDRHKLMQIIVNLLTNARDAVASHRGEGAVSVRVRRLPERRLLIEVEDDGIGIAADTLTRVFSQGFTTKTNGHGVGLHSSACAAGELGGSLGARSKGPDQGATFSLVLPE